MFTQIKSWLKGLITKKVEAAAAPVKELSGWEKYHQVMGTISTGLEAKVGETVNGQITDAVTQAKPKKKTSTKPAPKMSAKPAQDKNSAKPKKSTTKKK